MCSKVKQELSILLNGEALQTFAMEEEKDLVPYLTSTQQIAFLLDTSLVRNNLIHDL